MEGEEEADIKPVHVNWMVTASCPMKCRHCYVNQRFDGKCLSLEESKKLICEIAESGAKTICFTGGEPLERDDIFKLIKLARNKGLKTSLVTSGISVTSEKAKLLANLKVLVYLSMDGSRKEIHERVRGNGSWNVVLKASELLSKENVKFKTVMTLSLLNYEDTKDYPVTAKKLGAKEVCMIPGLPQGKLKNGLALGPLEFAKALYGAIEGSHKAGINLQFWCVPFLGVFGKDVEGVEYGSCRMTGVADISPKGDLLLCDVLDITLGNCVEKGFSRAYSELLNHSLFSLAHGCSPLIICKNCHQWLSCLGGCFARAYFKYGSLSGPDPLCPKIGGLN